MFYFKTVQRKFMNFGIWRIITCNINTYTPFAFFVMKKNVNNSFVPKIDVSLTSLDIFGLNKYSFFHMLHIALSSFRKANIYICLCISCSYLFVICKSYSAIVMWLLQGVSSKRRSLQLLSCLYKSKFLFMQ